MFTGCAQELVKRLASDLSSVRSPEGGLNEVPRSTKSKDLQARIPPHPQITLKDAVARDLYLTYREAAAYIRCTPSQVAAWVRRGHIDMYVHPSGRRVLRAVDVRDLLREGYLPAGEADEDAA